VRVSDDLLSVDLSDGRTISVPLAWYPRLLDATDEQRGRWRISGGGFGIHWPDLDEDLSTEGLLRGAPAPRAFAPSPRPVMATPGPEPADRIEWEEQDALIRIRRGLIGPEDVTRFLGHLLADDGERTALNSRTEQEPR
jgi:hypothetical protein